MEISGARTCQYCEYLWAPECPFYAIRTRRERDIEDPACSQFNPLEDVAMFKKRKQLGQFEWIKRQKKKEEEKKPLKRSIQF